MDVIFLRITILTNGPGELWGWVRPVCAELRRRGHTISLWVLPCQFSSGHEREAASLLGVDKLEGPAVASRIWHDIAYERTDSIIQLGGDTAFGRRMAECTNAPLFVYSYAPHHVNGAKLLTAYPSMSGQVPDVEVIGDLVKDAVALDSTPGALSAWNWNADPDSPRVIFLPGSRPAIRKPALSWLVDAQKALRQRISNVRIRTLFPPFVSDSELVEWRDAGLSPVKAGAGVAMREADFALTQPGTNTLELMHCGLPALVVAPTKFLPFVPIAGVLGFLAGLPIVGLKLRKFGAMRTIRKRGGFISLPNRIAKYKLMHEMYGDITPEDAAEEITERLSHPEALKKTRDELLALSGKAGAAARLCDIASAK